MRLYIIIIYAICNVSVLRAQSYCLNITGPIANQPNYTYNYTISATVAVDASIRIVKGDGTRGSLIGGSGTSISGSFTISTSNYTVNASAPTYGVTTQSGGVRVSEDCSGVLPIELINFNAQSTQQGNLLKWETASEINASHFEIEHSYDAKNFEKIGIINAQGKASQYQYLDKIASASVVYYRLKNVDTDSSFAYSKIVSVNNDIKGLNVKIFPNPFSEEINIDIVNDKELASLTIELLDVFAKQIYSKKSANTEGMSSILIPTKQLPTGTYFIKIQTPQQLIQQKMIKTF